jgi:hypothetical protein
MPTPNALCEMRTSFHGLKINGDPVEVKKTDTRKILKNGDRLSFGQTVIVIKTLD